ncbi:MAG: hypothetical protein OXU36_13875 [Candidatus Poribacteria bacterium]|nr:hypothetical protein [Candidatus Poribacteria bacterium]
MPIFRLEDDKLIIAQETNVELEQHLEIWLENSPWAVIQDELVLWIDRQPSAQDEEGTIFPDLLGVDLEGNLVIVEFKRGKTPREVIAQLLEYAAWANELSEEQIHDIADAYFEKRDEFQGRTFDEAFREMFDMPETDELPPLNRNLRLFIVAEEIPPRVARVCRFLRTSYGMDISCIGVSTFETESGEVLVSTETTVGDENVVVPKARQQRPSSPPRSPSDKPVEQIVWEAVQEFTDRDPNAIFAPVDILRVVLEKHPDLRNKRVRGWIRAGCVNYPERHTYPKAEDRYWQVARGKYRLYDPGKDKMEG